MILPIQPTVLKIFSAFKKVLFLVLPLFLSQIGFILQTYAHFSWSSIIALFIVMWVICNNVEINYSLPLKMRVKTEYIINQVRSTFLSYIVILYVFFEGKIVSDKVFYLGVVIIFILSVLLMVFKEREKFNFHKIL